MKRSAGQERQIPLKAFLLALLPLAASAIYLLAKGKGGVYLPNSEWNDELFYYKQVEAIVRYGYPQGYFGFNESRALQLSFAAWSPVLVLPWVLWGVVFGWNLLSPILCNLAFYTLVLFLFVVLTEPTWRQWARMALFFLLFAPNVRYILSGMPEVLCFGMVILFVGLSIRYTRSFRRGTLAMLLAMGVLMTWMRPYLILFLFLPLGFLIARFRRGRRWKGGLSALAVGSVAVGGYYLLNHYLSAEYFTPLFYTDWATAFFQKGFLLGLKGALGRILSQGRQALGHCIEGIRGDLASGLFFLAHLLLILLLFFQCVQELRRVRKERRLPLIGGGTDRGLAIVRLHYLLSCTAFFFALLLMYKLTEGSKHLLTFLAAGILLFALSDAQESWSTFVVSAAFVFLFFFHATSAYDFEVPTKTVYQEKRLAEWQEIFAAELELDTAAVPSFENTVIWVFSDLAPGYDEPEQRIRDLVDYRVTDWQILYALPRGMGISCCYSGYIENHFDELQSRYLCVSADGPIDRMCMEAGWTEIGRDRTTVVYRRMGKK